MMDDEGEARLKATYGENYGLAAVKKKYDLANLIQLKLTWGCRHVDFAYSLWGTSNNKPI